MCCFYLSIKNMYSILENKNVARPLLCPFCISMNIKDDGHHPCRYWRSKYLENQTSFEETVRTLYIALWNIFCPKFPYNLIRAFPGILDSGIMNSLHLCILDSKAHTLLGFGFLVYRKALCGGEIKSILTDSDNHSK